MMMAVGLLLIVCTVTVIDGAVMLTSAPVACPGDTVSFTCTSTTGALAWRSSGETKLYNVLSVDVTATLGAFRLTAVRQGMSTIVSKATVDSVMSSNNGATITCNDDIVSNAGSLSAVVRVTGPPGVLSNVQVLPLSLTSMRLTWNPPKNFTHCVRSYAAQFIHGTESTIFNTNNNFTMLTVTGLLQGVHYTISVAARDGQGRTGDESPQVFYTLDVLPPVKNIMMSLLHSNGTYLVVHLHWIAEFPSSYPPLLDYSLISDITSSSSLSLVTQVLSITTTTAVLMTSTKLHTTSYYFELVGRNVLGPGNPARRQIVVNALPQSIDQLNPTIYAPVLLQPTGSESVSPPTALANSPTTTEDMMQPLQCSSFPKNACKEHDGGACSFCPDSSLTALELMGTVFIVLFCLVFVIAIALSIFLIRAKKTSLMNTRVYAKFFIQRGKREKTVRLSSDKQKSTKSENRNVSKTRNKPGVTVQPRVEEMVSYEEVQDRSAGQSEAGNRDMVSYDEVIDHTKKSFEMRSNPSYPHVYYS